MKLANTDTKEKKQRLFDTNGYFNRIIALKRLERYANEIDMVLTKYNKKSCDETMMVKGLRKSCAETTNRKTHQEDLEKIVKEIAKKLGLNEQIVGIMGKHHDIGHTFLGHSGEWWISSIQEDMGIGYYCHNTLGARELIYTNKVYDEIINKIKVHNPNISHKMLGKIKGSLWLIMDGINAHNGEKPDKEYVPDTRKTEDAFKMEMLNCYTTKGYDRKVVPATAEACLMRLADQISYIPLDMLDGLREGLIRDKDGRIVSTLDEDYKRVLTNLGISNSEIEEANSKKEFGKIAERLKEIFINDVIQNSTKRKITMSKEIMKLMNELRSLNNEKAVNNVILKEDQETYPPAIRKLMERFSRIVLSNKLLNYMELTDNYDDRINAVKSYIGTPDEGFIRYICNMDKEDYEFTKIITEQATRQSIADELEEARQCVQKNEPYKDKEELGLSFYDKNYRIKSYIDYYKNQLKEGRLIGYNEETKEKEIDQIMEHIMNVKYSLVYLNMKAKLAMSLSAKYIATLNDSEFLQLLQDTEIIGEEQKKSLTKKYKDIDNLQSKTYIQEKWKMVQKVQKEAAKDDTQK